MKKSVLKPILLIGVLALIATPLFLVSCKNDNSGSGKGKGKLPPVVLVNPNIKVPSFSQDSAYKFIEKQLSFGPRVPNSAPHADCADWLIRKFISYGAEVQTQPAVVQAYDGTPLNMQNIIASYNPDRAQRIMLTAHWDTRPVADQDVERQDEPIPGANDGGSGVGVLLEIARLIGQDSNLNIGVDIILWDAEDYGNSNVPDSYCLGSQYWARNPHKANYNPVYGINLDMVGGINARFTQEGQSITYAPSVVQKVWNTSSKIGYSKFFSTLKTPGIIDDHLYINQIAKIPTIDIIDNQPGTSFFGQWHTHADDIHIISKETLKAVGQTVLTVVYNE
ncbi:MAG: M28 family peptidase [Bacteroidia bacterium]|nr:M28 family peptidase [Bacteroidia bacterium]